MHGQASQESANSMDLAGPDDPGGNVSFDEIFHLLTIRLTVNRVIPA